jgi:hypothetical protein
MKLLFSFFSLFEGYSFYVMTYSYDTYLYILHLRISYTPDLCIQN